MTTAEYLTQPSEAAPSASAAPRKKQPTKQQTKQPATTPPPVVPGRQGEGIYDTSPKNLENYAGPAPVEGIDYPRGADGEDIPYSRAERIGDNIKEDGLPTPRHISDPVSHIYGSRPAENVTKQASQPVPQASSTPYQNLVRMLYPEQEAQRYKEEQAKIERKRKRDAAISALGDGLAALSNLATVSRGAQNIDVSSSTLSDKSRERYDKINAERDARKDAYRNAMLNAAMRDRAEQIDADRASRANALAALQQAEQTRQFEETMRYNRERDDKLYANKEADRQLKSAQFEERMRIAWAKAYKSAHGGGKGGGGNNVIKGYPLTLKNGKTVYYANETAWKYAYGKEYPEEPLYDESQSNSNSENEYGEKTKKQSNTRKRSAANAAGARAANGGLGKAPLNL